MKTLAIMLLFVLTASILQPISTFQSSEFSIVTGNDWISISYESYNVMVAAKNGLRLFWWRDGDSQAYLCIYSTLAERLVLPNGVEINGLDELDPEMLANVIFKEPTLSELSSLMNASVAGYSKATSARNMEDLSALGGLITSITDELEQLYGRSILERVRTLLNDSINELEIADRLLEGSVEFEDAKDGISRAFINVTANLGEVIQIEARLSDIKRDFQNVLMEGASMFGSSLRLNFKDMEWRKPEFKQIKNSEGEIGYFFKVDWAGTGSMYSMLSLRGRVYSYDVVEKTGDLTLNLTKMSVILELVVEKEYWAADILNKALKYVGALSVKERGVVLLRELAVVKMAQSPEELIRVSIDKDYSEYSVLNETVTLDGLASPGVLIKSSGSIYYLALPHYITVNQGPIAHTLNEIKYIVRDRALEIITGYSVERNERLIERAVVGSDLRPINPSYEVKIDLNSGYTLESEPWILHIFRRFQYDPVILAVVFTVILVVASLFVVKSRYYP